MACRATGGGQQHQKQRPIGLVPSSWAAGFRAPHDGMPLGRAETPSACPAARPEVDFEEWQFVWHSQHPTYCIVFAAGARFKCS